MALGGLGVACLSMEREKILNFRFKVQVQSFFKVEQLFAAQPAAQSCSTRGVASALAFLTQPGALTGPWMLHGLGASGQQPLKLLPATVTKETLAMKVPPKPPLRYSAPRCPDCTQLLLMKALLLPPYLQQQRQHQEHQEHQ